MGFKYSSQGISMDRFIPAPPGVYTLIIKEASETDKNGNTRLTKNGDRFISVTCEIDDTNEWLGKKVWHNVMFLKKDSKGAGMSLHFLKTIGEPWEGDFDVTPENWVGKRFRAKLKVEKDFQGKDKNSIAYIVTEDEPADDTKLPF